VTAAPADAKPHRKWPVWKRVLAYSTLAALAAASVWFVDRDAMSATATNDPTPAIDH
jgi:hypothetical protein